MLYLVSLLLVLLPEFSPLAAIGGLTLFWKALEKEKRPFVAALLYFSAVHAHALTWLITFDYHGAYIVVVFVLVTLLLSVPLALAPVHSRRLLPLAAYFVLVEYTFQHAILCGFTMQQLGLLMTRNLYTAQLASVGGVLGLTFYVVWTNLMLWRAERFVYPVLLGVLPYFFGYSHYVYHAQQSAKAPVARVALVQTALRSEQKRPLGALKDFINPYEQWGAIFSYLGKGPSYDLIVLPEVAVPFEAKALLFDPRVMASLFVQCTGWTPELPERSLSNVDIAGALSKRFGAQVVIGLIDGYANAAFSLQGNRIERYEKRVLIPMAETLPLSALRGLSRRYGVGDFLHAGFRPVVFGSPLFVTPTICYEEMLSHVVREGRKAGGKVLVNLTNDVWYPSTPLPYKHFTTSKIRAIELGAPLLRACNSGVTAAIDSLVRINALFHLKGEVEWARGALITKVSLYNYQTLYLLWGENFILSLCAFCLMFYPLRKILLRHMLNDNARKDSSRILNA